MSEAIPLPDPDEPVETASELPEKGPFGDGERPSWLVGASHHAEPLVERTAPPQRPPVSLVRPDGGQAAPVSRFDPSRMAEAEAESASPRLETDPPATAWKPAASSVPTLRVAREPEAELPGFEEEPYTGDSQEGRQEGSSDASISEPALPPPDEPWWLVAMDHLASSRKLQIALVALIVGLGTWMFWPREENRTTPLSLIKHRPQEFEGRAVRVKGEVGEVFDVGSSFVFQLRQGRDTVVVFSPNRRPSPHDHLILEGTISTGYLDGTPRVALFERPAATTP